MAERKLFHRKKRTADTIRTPTEANAPEAPTYSYCSFCGQKYPAGTKHFCSVSDLIKYDLK